MKPHLILFLLTSFAIACNQKTTPKSGSKISVSSPNPIPGETIIISAGRVLSNKDAVEVKFNETTAPIIKIEDSLVEVLVPEFPPGPVSVTLSANKIKSDAVPVTIKEHPTRKLILNLTHDGKIEKLGEKLTNDEIARPEMNAGSKISYELFDADNQLLVSGLTADPRGGMEIFDDPQKKIYREKPGHMGGTFTVNVPNVRGAMRLKLYSTQLSNDSNNNKALLDRRQLIGEINLQ